MEIINRNTIIGDKSKPIHQVIVYNLNSISGRTKTVLSHQIAGNAIKLDNRDKELVGQWRIKNT